MFPHCGCEHLLGVPAPPRGRKHFRTAQVDICSKPLVGAGFMVISLSAVSPASDPLPSIENPPASKRLDQPSSLSLEALDLSRAPTAEELMAAGQLGGRLLPTHDLTDKRRAEAADLAFGKAIEELNKHEYPKAVAIYQKHLEEYPHSPWAAEAALHICCGATYNGRYTEAKASFQKRIADHQGKDLRLAAAIQKATLMGSNERPRVPNRPRQATSGLLIHPDLTAFD